MSPLLMSLEQQFLPEGTATRVVAAEVDRELLVTAGRLWLTTAGATGGGDVWLTPGDRHLLRAGEEAVIEGWPSASFGLRRTQRSATPASLLRNAVARWRAGWRRRRSATAVPPGCCSC